MNITRVGKEFSEVWISQLKDGECFIEVKGKDDVLYMKGSSIAYNRQRGHNEDVMVKINLIDGYVSIVDGDYEVIPVGCDLIY